jgi:hypothetical protein
LEVAFNLITIVGASIYDGKGDSNGDGNSDGNGNGNGNGNGERTHV